ncbi:unnamed protein product [Rotaria sordida]|uniref:Uncharacterized protein n=2 Tax=Rotaria sordida TaxID=392033 RepID=A0A814GYY0_9BILA|nr:unnamed protein product [Rotaria sordida]
MEKLANLTQNDIDNGVLNRMLVNAGISDVQEYVNNFHQETEELLVEEFKHPDLNRTNNDEQIAPPADVQSWIMGLRLRLDDPIQPPLPKQQEPQKQQPIDVQSWMHGMIPDNMHPSTDNTAPEISTTSSEDSAVTGNLGTWLTDWSKNLSEQPPPKSLDDWLQGLIPNNMQEPIGKANSSKVRLNSYLNAAQKKNNKIIDVVIIAFNVR